MCIPLNVLCGEVVMWCDVSIMKKFLFYFYNYLFILVFGELHHIKMYLACLVINWPI